MKIKPAIFTAAYAFIAIGPINAAAQPGFNQAVGTAIVAEQTVPNPVIGFGSGTGMGPAGGTGSASSLSGGFSSQMSGSGSGGQTFGGGFNQQQTIGSGPLSRPSMTGTASTGSGAMGPR
ncbi:MAG: hypothetical protein Q8O29_04425 [Polaromonas sp.]|uniref:hypothetical protein n=1 Tax=Polaromonas sp. TaxID=1869339 RepID=UPI0027370D30|nr:hypothetical protein [Polaromonas sp.]MDP2817517.1 hypothetical protein [Polaromonas sp.]